MSNLNHKPTGPFDFLDFEGFITTPKVNFSWDDSLHRSSVEHSLDTPHLVTFGPAKIFNIDIDIDDAPGLPSLGDLPLDTSSLSNKVTQERSLDELTDRLLSMIRNDVFESGYSTGSELFVNELLERDPLGTKDWLSRVYLRNFGDFRILVGLLHIISHVDYELIYPQGQIIALGSLRHKNVEVRDNAIRAFENWGHPDSIDALRNIYCPEKWLQEYVDKVIRDLEEELG